MRAFVVAAALLAIAAPAFAQTTPPATPPAAAATPLPPAPPPEVCTGFAPAPTLPDGATATRAQMAAADQEFLAWGTAVQAKLMACRAEVLALDARAQGARNAHNAEATELRSVSDAWAAEGAEFNARPASRRR